MMRRCRRHGDAMRDMVMVKTRAQYWSAAEAIARGVAGADDRGVRNEKPSQIAIVPERSARAVQLPARGCPYSGRCAACFRTRRRSGRPRRSTRGASPGRSGPYLSTAKSAAVGRTDHAFDWSRIEGRPDLGRSIAGGLRPSNARAAPRVGAFALDVGSGVEMAPGRKDAGRLYAFFEALRPPARGEAGPCG